MLDNKNNKYYGVDSGCGSPQNWGNLQSAYSLRSHQSWWTSKSVKSAVLGLGLATLLPMTSAFGATQPVLKWVGNGAPSTGNVDGSTVTLSYGTPINKSQVFDFIKAYDPATGAEINGDIQFKLTKYVGDVKKHGGAWTSDLSYPVGGPYNANADQTKDEKVLVFTFTPDSTQYGDQYVPVPAKCYLTVTQIQPTLNWENTDPNTDNRYTITYDPAKGTYDKLWNNPLLVTASNDKVYGYPLWGIFSYQVDGTEVFTVEVSPDGERMVKNNNVSITTGSKPLKVKWTPQNYKREKVNGETRINPDVTEDTVDANNYGSQEISGTLIVNQKSLAGIFDWKGDVSIVYGTKLTPEVIATVDTDVLSDGYATGYYSIGKKSGKTNPTDEVAFGKYLQAAPYPGYSDPYYLTSTFAYPNYQPTGNHDFTLTVTQAECPEIDWILKDRVLVGTKLSECGKANRMPFVKDVVPGKPNLTGTFTYTYNGVTTSNPNDIVLDTPGTATVTVSFTLANNTYNNRNYTYANGATKRTDNFTIDVYAKKDPGLVWENPSGTTPEEKKLWTITYGTALKLQLINDPNDQGEEPAVLNAYVTAPDIVNPSKTVDGQFVYQPHSEGELLQVLSTAHDDAEDSYLLTVNFLPSDANAEDYATATTDMHVKVNPATPTVNWNPESILYGTKVDKEFLDTFLQQQADEGRISFTHRYEVYQSQGQFVIDPARKVDPKDDSYPSYMYTQAELKTATLQNPFTLGEIPDEGTYDIALTFIPEDDRNFNSIIEAVVQLQVGKFACPILGWKPTNLTFIYGEVLGNDQMGVYEDAADNIKVQDANGDIHYLTKEHYDDVKDKQGNVIEELWGYRVVHADETPDTFEDNPLGTISYRLYQGDAWVSDDGKAIYVDGQTAPEDITNSWIDAESWTDVEDPSTYTDTRGYVSGKVAVDVRKVYDANKRVVPAKSDYQLVAVFTPSDPANYDVTYAASKLIVNKAEPNIDWTIAPIDYGTPATAADQLNATISWSVDSRTESWRVDGEVTTTVYTYGDDTNPLPAKKVEYKYGNTVLNDGNIATITQNAIDDGYALTVTYEPKENDENYAKTSDTETLNVIKAPLKFIAKELSIPADSEVPTYQYAIVGKIYDAADGADAIYHDNQIFAEIKTWNIMTAVNDKNQPYQKGSPNGQYTITFTEAGQREVNKKAANYAIQYIPSTLYVGAKTTVEWKTKPEPITENDALVPGQKPLNAQAYNDKHEAIPDDAGTYTYTVNENVPVVPNVTKLTPGINTLNVSWKPNADQYYQSSTATIDMLVKDVPEIIWSHDWQHSTIYYTPNDNTQTLNDALVIGFTKVVKYGGEVLFDATTGDVNGIFKWGPDSLHDKRLEAKTYDLYLSFYPDASLNSDFYAYTAIENVHVKLTVNPVQGKVDWTPMFTEIYYGADVTEREYLGAKALYQVGGEWKEVDGQPKYTFNNTNPSVGEDELNIVFSFEPTDSNYGVVSGKPNGFGEDDDFDVLRPNLDVTWNGYPSNNQEGKITVPYGTPLDDPQFNLTAVVSPTQAPTLNDDPGATHPNGLATGVNAPVAGDYAEQKVYRKEGSDWVLINEDPIGLTLPVGDYKLTATFIPTDTNYLPEENETDGDGNNKLARLQKEAFLTVTPAKPDVEGDFIGKGFIDVETNTDKVVDGGFDTRTELYYGEYFVPTLDLENSESYVDVQSFNMTEPRMTLALSVKGSVDGQTDTLLTPDDLDKPFTFTVYEVDYAIEAITKNGNFDHWKITPTYTELTTVDLLTDPTLNRLRLPVRPQQKLKYPTSSDASKPYPNQGKTFTLPEAYTPYAFTVTFIPRDNVDTIEVNYNDYTSKYAGLFVAATSDWNLDIDDAIENDEDEDIEIPWSDDFSPSNLFDKYVHLTSNVNNVTKVTRDNKEVLEFAADDISDLASRTYYVQLFGQGNWYTVDELRTLLNTKLPMGTHNMKAKVVFNQPSSNRYAPNYTNRESGESGSVEFTVVPITDQPEMTAVVVTDWNDGEPDPDDLDPIDLYYGGPAFDMTTLNARATELKIAKDGTETNGRLITNDPEAFIYELAGTDYRKIVTYQMLIEPDFLSAGDYVLTVTYEDPYHYYQNADGTPIYTQLNIRVNKTMTTTTWSADQWNPVVIPFTRTTSYGHTSVLNAVTRANGVFAPVAIGTDGLEYYIVKGAPDFVANRDKDDPADELLPAEPLHAGTYPVYAKYVGTSRYETSHSDVVEITITSAKLSKLFWSTGLDKDPLTPTSEQDPITQAYGTEPGNDQFTVVAIGALGEDLRGITGDDLSAGNIKYPLESWPTEAGLYHLIAKFQPENGDYEETAVDGYLRITPIEPSYTWSNTEDEPYVVEVEYGYDPKEAQIIKVFGIADEDGKPVDITDQFDLSEKVYNTIDWASMTEVNTTTGYDLELLVKPINPETCNYTEFTAKATLYVKGTNPTITFYRSVPEMSEDGVIYSDWEKITDISLAYGQTLTWNEGDTYVVVDQVTPIHVPATVKKNAEVELQATAQPTAVDGYEVPGTRIMAVATGVDGEEDVLDGNFAYRLLLAEDELSFGALLEPDTYQLSADYTPEEGSYYNTYSEAIDVVVTCASDWNDGGVTVDWIVPTTYSLNKDTVWGKIFQFDATAWNKYTDQQLASVDEEVIDPATEEPTTITTKLTYFIDGAEITEDEMEAFLLTTPELGKYTLRAEYTDEIHGYGKGYKEVVLTIKPAKLVSHWQENVNEIEENGFMEYGTHLDIGDYANKPEACTPASGKYLCATFTYGNLVLKTQPVSSIEVERDADDVVTAVIIRDLDGQVIENLVSDVVYVYYYDIDRILPVGPANIIRADYYNTESGMTEPEMTSAQCSVIPADPDIFFVKDVIEDKAYLVEGVITSIVHPTTDDPYATVTTEIKGTVEIVRGTKLDVSAWAIDRMTQVDGDFVCDPVEGTPINGNTTVKVTFTPKAKAVNNYNIIESTWTVTTTARTPVVVNEDDLEPLSAVYGEALDFNPVTALKIEPEGWGQDDPARYSYTVNGEEFHPENVDLLPSEDPYDLVVTFTPEGDIYQPVSVTIPLTVAKAALVITKVAPEDTPEEPVIILGLTKMDFTVNSSVADLTTKIDFTSDNSVLALETIVSEGNVATAIFAADNPEQDVPVTVTASFAGNEYYNSAEVTWNAIVISRNVLQITPYATITVKYGDPIPAQSQFGYEPKDVEVSGIDGYTTTYNPDDEEYASAGDYPITIEHEGELTAPGYDNVEPLTGTLKVEPADAPLTVAELVEFTYGDKEAIAKIQEAISYAPLTTEEVTKLTATLTPLILTEDEEEEVVEAAAETVEDGTAAEDAEDLDTIVIDLISGEIILPEGMENIPAGSYKLTVVIEQSNGNYTSPFTAYSTLIVDQAEVLIVPDDQTMNYNDPAWPTLTWKVSLAGSTDLIDPEVAPVVVSSVKLGVFDEDDTDLVDPYKENTKLNPGYYNIALLPDCEVALTDNRNYVLADQPTTADLTVLGDTNNVIVTWDIETPVTYGNSIPLNAIVVDKYTGETLAYGTDPEIDYVYYSVKDGSRNTLEVNNKLPAGLYDVWAIWTDDGIIYDSAYFWKRIEVVQAALTVNVDPKTAIYGEDRPELTYTTVPAELKDSVKVDLHCDYHQGDDVGNYPITATVEDKSYAVTINNNVLDVSPATAVVDFVFEYVADEDEEITEPLVLTYGDQIALNEDDPAIIDITAPNGDLKYSIHAVANGCEEVVEGVFEFTVGDAILVAGEPYTVEQDCSLTASFTTENKNYVSPAEGNIDFEVDVAEVTIDGFEQPEWVITYPEPLDLRGVHAYGVNGEALDIEFFLDGESLGINIPEIAGLTPNEGGYTLEAKVAAEGYAEKEESTTVIVELGKLELVIEDPDVDATNGEPLVINPTVNVEGGEFTYEATGINIDLIAEIDPDYVWVPGDQDYILTVTYTQDVDPYYESEATAEVSLYVNKAQPEITVTGPEEITGATEGKFSATISFAELTEFIEFSWDSILELRNTELADDAIVATFWAMNPEQDELATVTASYAGDEYYAPAEGFCTTLVTSRRVLEITAKTVTIAYGADEPAQSEFGYTPDDVEVSGITEYKTTYVKGAPVGDYMIFIEGNLSAPGYDNVIDTEQGKLIVKQATAELTVDELVEFTYGDEDAIAKIQEAFSYAPLKSDDIASFTAILTPLLTDEDGEEAEDLDVIMIDLKAGQIIEPAGMENIPAANYSLYAILVQSNGNYTPEVLDAESIVIVDRKAIDINPDTAKQGYGVPLDMTFTTVPAGLEDYVDVTLVAVGEDGIVYYNGDDTLDIGFYTIEVESAYAIDSNYTIGQLGTADLVVSGDAAFEQVVWTVTPQITYGESIPLDAIVYDYVTGSRVTVAVGSDLTYTYLTVGELGKEKTLEPNNKLPVGKYEAFATWKPEATTGYLPTDSGARPVEVLPANPQLTLSTDAPATLHKGDTITVIADAINDDPEGYTVTFTTDDAVLVLVEQVGNKATYEVLVAEAAEPVEISAVIAATANYSEGEASLFVSVAKADLTITIDPQTITYGDALPELTYSPKTVEIEPKPVAYTGDAGTYVITADPVEDADYNVIIVDSELVVNKADLTIKIDDKTAKYGEALPEFTYEPTTVEIDPQPVAYTGDAGTYVITANAVEDKNYNVTIEDGELVVSKAALTIATPELTTVYGVEVQVPAEPTYTGLVNGDTAATIGATTKTDYSAASSVGTYAIEAVYTEEAVANYNVTKDFGYVEVTAATPTITFVDLSTEEVIDELSINYGSTVAYDEDNDVIVISTTDSESYIMAVAAYNGKTVSGEFTYFVNDVELGEYRPDLTGDQPASLSCVFVTEDPNFAPGYYEDGIDLYVDETEVVITGLPEVINVMAPAMLDLSNVAATIYNGDPYEIEFYLDGEIFDWENTPLTAVRSYELTAELVAYGYYAEPATATVIVDVNTTDMVLSWNVAPTIDYPAEIALNATAIADGVDFSDDVVYSELTAAGEETLVQPLSAGKHTLVAKYVPETGSPYAPTSIERTVTVNPITVTVTALDQTIKVNQEPDPKAYTVDPANAPVSVALDFGDYVAGVAGEYVITPVAATDNLNYTIAEPKPENKGTLTVTELDAVYIIPVVGPITYGDPKPAQADYSYVTEPAGVTIIGTPEYDTIYNDGDDATKYGYLVRILNPTELKAEGYDVVFTKHSNLVVNQKALKITAESTSVEYDKDAPALTATFDGLIAGDDVVAEVKAPTYKAGSPVVDGGYPTTVVAVSGKDAKNYSYEKSLVDGTLTVTPAPQKVTLTVDPATLKVGETAKISASSDKQQEVVIVISDTSILSENGVALKEGTVTITATADQNKNYVKATDTKTVTVTKKDPIQVTVTAIAGEGMIYGDNVLGGEDGESYLSYTAVDPDGKAVAGTIIYSVKGIDIDYAVEINPAENKYQTLYAANYTVTPVFTPEDAEEYKVGTVETDTLTVGQAPLTITVGNGLAIYNKPADLSNVTVTVEGLVGDDEVEYEVVTDYEVGDPALVPYEITVELKGEYPDYDVTIVPGTLVVEQDADGATVVWSVEPSIVYGTPIELNAKVYVYGELQKGAEVKYFLDDTVEISPDEPLMLFVGDWNLKAVFVAPVGAGYTDAVTSIDVKVTKAPLTVTLDDAEVVYNETLVTPVAKVEGLLEGDDVTYEVDGSFYKAGTTDAGTYKDAIIATLTGEDAFNYDAPEQLTSTLTVKKATQEVLLAVNPTVLNVDESATATVVTTSGLPATIAISDESILSPNLVALKVGTVTVIAKQAGDNNYEPAESDPVIVTVAPKADVQITWEPKSPIAYGTILSAEHLNATASLDGQTVEGHFYYNPTFGYVVTPESRFVVNGKLRLSATFVPTDRKRFKNAYIEVLVDIETEDATTDDDGEEAPALTISKAGSAKGLVNAAADALVITFTGTLEESTDGVTWTPVVGAEDGIYVVDVKVANQKFYRSVK